MAGPIPNRPIPRGKKTEPPKRALTAKERRSKKTATYVTWFLVFVFSVTSVGFLIGFKPDQTAQGNAPESERQQLEERLKAIQRQSAERPDEPQFYYDQARLYLQLGQVPGEGKSEGYLDKAVEQYRKTLERAPGHLPALHELSSIYLSRGKDKEAADVLTRGIAQEKKELDQQKAQRKADDPEPPPPDVQLRALLFRAELGLPGHEAQAAAAAREALNLNPKAFLQMLQPLVLQLALSDKKATAEQAVRIALKEAEALGDKPTVDDIKKLQDAVSKFNVPLPSPSARAAASPAPAASPVASPAAPAPTTSPAGSPAGGPAPVTSESPMTPVAVPSASPAPAGAASSVAPAGSPSATP